ncbi:hypothetical protein SAMN00017477_0623 [Peptoniphilus asaccharolyticus DSM 20463]|uniref:Uncharacterized protein n=1 Tax=Peptoniphilus asaccharolyticus DSM 20463 TaxID=573058 RepID=A0A1W1US60_PEPAS|nr:hypothetical protein [Peptoniphilus asaccharolyticus]SMB83927.1 hypothetical protein SAMN00017477_0623 [Peptoniphilus asaccharolyticus DSM 20463]
MNKENSHKTILTFSIIFLVVTSVIFAYSKLKYNSYLSELNNLESLKKELQNIKEEVEVNSKSLAIKEKDLNDKSIEFFTTYGFDYLKEDDELVQEEVKRLQDENNRIKNDLKEELKKYIHYFDGEYYESEDFSGLVAKITSLDDREISEQLNPDIYSQLAIDGFMNEAKKTGTIAYLNSINGESKFNNLLLFLTAIYSDNLYEVSHDLTDIPENLNSIYNNVLTTHQIFKTLESFELNTGTLTSTNLNELVYNTEAFVRKYYENQAVIAKLTGETYEKSE